MAFRKAGDDLGGAAGGHCQCQKCGLRSQGALVLPLMWPVVEDSPYTVGHGQWELGSVYITF